jgi:O-antigen ligase
MFLVANDILMVIMPGRFYGDGISKTFLLGDKFSTSYDHMIFLLIVCLLYGERHIMRRTLPLLFAVVCLLCKYMDCNTASLGTLVFLAIAYTPKNIRSVLSRKSVVLVVLILCASFVFSESALLLPPVKYFITEVLGRDVTLTGRSEIYQVLGKVIRAHPWIGYGSSAEVMLKYTGAYNAQNGFFDLVVQNGFPSALLYVALILSLIREKSTPGSKYLLGIMYGCFIMSTVEITFFSVLLLFGILLFTETDDYAENPVRIIEWRCKTIDSRTPVCQ